MKKSGDFKRCYKYFSRFAWEHNKTYFIWLILGFIIYTTGPFISIIGTQYLVDEIAPGGSRETGTIILWVLFLSLGNFIYKSMAKLCDENQGRINENFYRILSTRVSTTSLDIRFQDTEDTKVLDIIKNAERAINETGGVNGLISPIFDLISDVFVVGGVIVYVLTNISWLSFPIIASFFVNFFLLKVINKIRRKYFEEVGQLERGIDYYNTELMEPRYAKDLRLYNNGEVFIDKYDGFMNKLFLTGRKYTGKLNGVISINAVIRNMLTIVIYLLIGFYAIKKWISIGTFTALFQATSKFNDAAWGISDSYRSIDYTVSVLKFYLDFMDRVYIEHEESDEYHVSDEKCRIEFRNVSFKYPNTDRYILRNISTVINEGEHLSIVGQNGAGKTTFIKLLCKLYDNYEGDILVNNRNIKEIALEEYVDLLSVVFQDFRLFAFTLKENVTVFKKTDMELQYVYNTSGIRKWIDSLEKKDKTYIYKMFEEDGVEPSGGEGQKLAIARALYKNAPIVVLDEPTAALDPIAENEVYMNFDKLVQDKTAIYISHRLSSCKFCDRIIVFEGGQIIEEGSHDELISKDNGFYAKMFHTQASQYQKEKIKI